MKFLEARGTDCTVIPIREQPPTVAELGSMLAFLNGDIRKLFNTSGQDYKQLNLKERLPKMNEAEAIKLLSKNGNLVKRPFVLWESGGLVGFKEEEWKRRFG
jgi:arsenate reductase